MKFETSNLEISKFEISKFQSYNFKSLNVQYGILKVPIQHKSGYDKEPEDKKVEIIIEKSQR